MNIENLGEPDLHLLGLKLWIPSRQFADSTDYWDGNWVYVTACCSAPFSQVYAQGSFLHLSELQHWLEQLKLLHKNSKGVAEMDCMEPNFYARIELNSLGTGTLVVKLTPNHLSQKHEVEFEIDQSYLPKAIKDIEEIMKTYPIKK